MLSLAELLAAHCRPLAGHAAMSATEVEQQLAALPGWRAADDSRVIERRYAFANYYETLAFVNALAWVVHRADHHPELRVSYNRCTVRFDTHSVGGVSMNDFICAAQADALYARAPGAA